MPFKSISINNTQADPLVINQPSPAPVAGDTLIAYCWSDDTATTVAAAPTGWPAGFVPITGVPVVTTRDGMCTFAAIKIATGSEPANYTIDASGGIMGGIVCFSGRESSTTPHRQSVADNDTANASPFSITSGAYSGGNTGSTCDICMIVGSDVNNANVTHDPASSGLTERADQQDTVGDFINGAVFTLDGVAPGNTGVFTVTGTTTGTSGWSAIVIALADAAGGGGDVPPTQDLAHRQAWQNLIAQ